MRNEIMVESIQIKVFTTPRQTLPKTTQEVFIS